MVGSNARKRGECQADQCRIRVDGNWNELCGGYKEKCVVIGNSCKVDGKKLEIIGKD